MSIAYDYSRETVAPVSASKPQLLLIDGQRVPSASGRTFKSLNPATEQVIATIAEGNEAEQGRKDDPAVAHRSRDRHIGEPLFLVDSELAKLLSQFGLHDVAPQFHDGSKPRR